MPALLNVACSEECNTHPPTLPSTVTGHSLRHPPPPPPPLPLPPHLPPPPRRRRRRRRTRRVGCSPARLRVAQRRRRSGKEVRRGEWFLRGKEGLECHPRTRVSVAAQRARRSSSWLTVLRGTASGSFGGQHDGRVPAWWCPQPEDGVHGRSVCVCVCCDAGHLRTSIPVGELENIRPWTGEGGMNTAENFAGESIGTACASLARCFRRVLNEGVKGMEKDTVLCVFGRGSPCAQREQRFSVLFLLLCGIFSFFVGGLTCSRGFLRGRRGSAAVLGEELGCEACTTKAAC